MPIIVIWNDGGAAPPKKDREKQLIREQKRNPFDININIRLAAFYREQNNWPEAEHHEEFVEWIDRINRFVKSR